MYENYWPTDLRFTHDSIKTTFQDGHTMEETLKDILAGRLSVSSLPSLVVMKYHGRLHVVRGNRRLYLYQLLQRHDLIGKITVQMDPFDEVLFEKMYTSTNHGKSVRLRGYYGFRMDDDLNEIIKNHRYGSSRRGYSGRQVNPIVDNWSEAFPPLPSTPRLKTSRVEHFTPTRDGFSSGYVHIPESSESRCNWCLVAAIVIFIFVCIVFSALK